MKHAGAPGERGGLANEGLLPFMQRLARAHATCIEGLPIFGGLLAIAIMASRTAITDPLAFWLLGARIRCRPSPNFASWPRASGLRGPVPSRNIKLPRRAAGMKFALGVATFGSSIPSCLSFSSAGPVEMIEAEANPAARAVRRSILFMACSLVRGSQEPIIACSPVSKYRCWNALRCLSRLFAKAQ
jgi:hypothetical protein